MFRFQGIRVRENFDRDLNLLAIDCGKSVSGKGEYGLCVKSVKLAICEYQAKEVD